MPDLPFSHPVARRKRAKAINAEMDAAFAWFASQRPARVVVPVLPPEKRGTIYFVGPEGGPIKIGYASRLEFRLRDLRTMNAMPLVVHATIEGPASLEREYHRRFAAHRLHGEWFAPHPDVLAEIERLAHPLVSKGLT